MTARETLSKFGRYLPLVVTLVLLVPILLYFDGFHLLEQADVPILLLGVLVALSFDATFAAFKLWVVVRLVGPRPGYGKLLKLHLGLLPAVFFAPFQSGHLLTIVALRNSLALPAFQALECVAYDKWLSLVGTFALIAIGQALVPADHPLSNVPILLAGLGVVALYLADGLVFRLLGRFRFIRERSALLVRPVGLVKKLGLLLFATVYQSSDAISMLFACWCLGLPIEPALVFGVFPVVLLITYVPLSFSGFGVRENLVVLFLGAALTDSGAASAGLLVGLFNYVAPAVLGLVALPYVLRVLSRGRKGAEEDVGETGDATPRAS